jgi:RimJ/RimL family protein N-acetyltransferase
VNRHFVAIYFLRTSRLGFRTWTPDDLDLALSLWGDPDVTRLIGGPFSREQVEARLEREIATFAAHGVQYFPIFLLENSDHVGCCGLRPYQPDQHVYELGFHLCKAHWGKGYAKEAALSMIHYGFTTLGASALFAGHNPANDASRGLLTALGFRYSHDEFYPPTGLMHPSYLLSAADFAEHTNAS